MNTFNNLKSNLSDQDIDELVAIIGHRCHPKTKTRIRSILKYGASKIPTLGILGRLSKESYGWQYFAGQSYPDEIKLIKKIILSIGGAYGTQ
jgi:hypothetical protein